MPQYKMGEEAITTNQLAERWSLTPKTLELWRKKRFGPKFMRMGKGPSARIRYLLKDVIAWEIKRSK